MTHSPNARARTRFGRMLLVSWVIGAVGCSDVTEPVAPTPAPATALVAQVLPPDVGDVINDALGRVLPAMGDEAGSKGLEAALEALLEALSRRESSSAMASVESAEQVLEAFARGVGPADGDAVHVDVIGLALASVRARVMRQ